MNSIDFRRNIATNPASTQTFSSSAWSPWQNNTDEPLVSVPFITSGQSGSKDVEVCSASRNQPLRLNTESCTGTSDTVRQTSSVTLTDDSSVYLLMILDGATEFSLAIPTRAKRAISAASATDTLTIGWTVWTGSPNILQNDAGTVTSVFLLEWIQEVFVCMAHECQLNSQNDPRTWASTIKQKINSNW